MTLDVRSVISRGLSRSALARARQGWIAALIAGGTGIDPSLLIFAFVEAADAQPRVHSFFVDAPTKPLIFGGVDSSYQPSAITKSFGLETQTQPTSRIIIEPKVSIFVQQESTIIQNRPVIPVAETLWQDVVIKANIEDSSQLAAIDISVLQLLQSPALAATLDNTVQSFAVTIRAEAVSQPVVVAAKVEE